jgi:hemoglobin
VQHPVVEAPMPTPKEKSLYERLGGEAAVKAVVEDFVERAAANPKVNFTRKGTPNEWKPTPDGLTRLKQMLVDFVGSATGGPQKYTGKSMKDAHQGMQITADEFNALAADLKASLDKFNVPAKEQDELLKAVAGTAKDIITEPKGK